MSYAQIIEATKRDGGVTYQLRTHSSPHPGANAYMVSPYPERSDIVDVTSLTPERLRGFVSHNRKMLTQSNHYLGTWYDKDATGKVFLDVVIRVNTPEQAESICRRKRQIAYYSYKDMQAHDVQANPREEDEAFDAAGRIRPPRRRKPAADPSAHATTVSAVVRAHHSRQTCRI